MFFGQPQWIDFTRVDSDLGVRRPDFTCPPGDLEFLGGEILIGNVLAPGVNEDAQGKQIIFLAGRN